MKVPADKVQSYALSVIEALSAPPPPKPLSVPEGGALVSPTEMDPDTGELKQLFRNPGRKTFETAAETEISKRAVARLSDVSEDGQAARMDELAISQLEELTKEGTGINTGMTAAARGYLARVGVDLGDADDLQVFESLTDRLTPAQRQGLPGAASDRDVSMFKSALPQLIRQPEANRVIIGTMRALVDDRIARGRIADKVFKGETTVPATLREISELPSPFQSFNAWREIQITGLCESD